MFFIDTHIHFQDYKTQDVKNVVTNAFKNNVRQFINVSAYPDDWPKVKKAAEKNEFIIPAFGIHPWYINYAHKNWVEILEQYLRSTSKSWIGECGIDRIKNEDIALQLAILQPQLQLAKEYNRPLILHAVKANDVITKIFSELPQKTIFHSFTGSAEWGKEIQKHGFYIGLNFSILKKKNYINILQSLDLNRILLETDGPYQSLKKNEETLPQNLPDLAQKIASDLQISTENFNNILYQNWINFSGENHG